MDQMGIERVSPVSPSFFSCAKSVLSILSSMRASGFYLKVLRDNVHSNQYSNFTVANIRALNSVQIAPANGIRSPLRTSLCML